MPAGSGRAVLCGVDLRRDAGLSPAGELAVLGLGMMVFHLTHGWAQEFMFSLPGFTFGSLVTMAEIAAYLLCALVERPVVAALRPWLRARRRRRRVQRGAHLFSLSDDDDDDDDDDDEDEDEGGGSRGVVRGEGYNDAAGHGHGVVVVSTADGSHAGGVERRRLGGGAGDGGHVMGSNVSQAVQVAAERHGGEGWGVDKARPSGPATSSGPGKPPFWAGYLAVSVLLSTSQWLGNASLAWGVSYPAKVMTKSGKLIPVMLFGRCVTGHVYSRLEYAVALGMSLGIAMFALADNAVHEGAVEEDPGDDDGAGLSAMTSSTSSQMQGVGLLLLAGSVLCDALLANFQQKILQQWGGKQVDMVVATNGLALIQCLLVIVATPGSLTEMGAWFAQTTESSVTLTLVMLAEAVTAYAGTYCLLNIVSRFGSVPSMFASNLRKAVTVYLSFIVFPKPWSGLYLAGGILVFGAAAAQIQIERAKSGKNSDTGSGATARQRGRTRGGLGAGGAVLPTWASESVADL